MPDIDSAAHFDDSSDTFDADVGGGGEEFPFAGYDAVLSATAEAALAGAPRRVLDLGCGTGTLLARLGHHSPGTEVWGIDRSPRMIERARDKVPTASLVIADFAGDLTQLGLPQFDAIVSTYALHEVSDERKLDLLSRLRIGHLAPTGTMAIGDIAFERERDRDDVRAQTNGWDDSEHYLVAD